ncbi:enoyl-CoA hydratase/isomerase family protein [Mesorhizobium sp. B2-4-13]|uniref:enoyl-CoA hydratase/isomerase family protein n=1 Tax=Mesorhizobium sp. B2-4-13 TaxID=2589936 RepID=UPI00114EAE6D|nr:enoyl-CoA hydratase/isomerase family protein [Mesorhizobium sp. B2-4-13]TPK87038.1 enoyl-CoA hydratase/isomerase family protein [Mesorhizobium sp. B2-4-13]
MTIQSEVKNGVGIIWLDRPRSLNALDPPMIEAIEGAFLSFDADPKIKRILVRSRSDRAFCAGGDLKAIRELCLEGRYDAALRFFAAEYRLNLAISRASKPYVSIVDGLCMGGGLGLTMHGGYSIATERSLFSMPETQIGFIPDVGASYVLPRLQPGLGRWIALTGSRMTGMEAVAAGLATHFIHSESLPHLTAVLTDPTVGIEYALRETVSSRDCGSGDLPSQRTLAHFELSSLDGIMKSLAADHDATSKKSLALLRAASGNSCRAAVRLLDAGANDSLESCLRRELTVASTAIRHPDFIEGVRAILVDKDRLPVWQDRIADGPIGKQVSA